jgi:serine/threonine-protein kinase
MHGRNAETWRFGPFRYDPADGVRRGAAEVPLPPRALAVLAVLLARPGVVIPKQDLLDAVWPGTYVTESSLLEAIRVLRLALGDDRLHPTYIQTVHRRGYRFVATVIRETSPGNREPQVPVAADHPVPGSRLPVPVPFLSGPEWRPIVAACLTSLAATVAMAVVLALLGPREVPRPTSRFSIALPDDTAIDPLRGSLAVSADGRRMVFVALQDGHPRLFLRSIDRDEPVAIEGTEGAADPFFSPDGESVGFFAHGSLKRIPVTGGAPFPICAARSGAGASWSSDGTIVFGGADGSGLARVPATGGEPVPLASPIAGSLEVRYVWPEVLPGGRAVIYTSVTLAGSDIALLDLRTGERRYLISSAAFGRYSPTGHLVFERRGQIEAAPFSASEWSLAADPRPIVRGVATAAALEGPRFAFSRAGSLLYVPGRSIDTGDTLHWLNRDGRLERVPLPAIQMAHVELAPNQRQLALTMESESGPDLWIGDLQGGPLRRLAGDGPSLGPAWRPDGLEIAFASSKAGPFNLFIRDAGGRDGALPLTDSPWNQLPTSWSPDGRSLAFTEFHPRTGADIWVLDLPSRTRRPIVRSLFDESGARFSPDGHWVAYASNESGRWEVYVRAVDGSGFRVQASRAGGLWPGWSADGRTLYFNANGRTAAAAVRTVPTLSLGAPLDVPGANALLLAGGDAGGTRVLVRRPALAPARGELRVVLGWFAELERLLRRPA